MMANDSSREARAMRMPPRVGSPVSRPWVVHRSALRRLLAILDKAERTIESVTRERDDLLERVPGA